MKGSSLVVSINDIEDLKKITDSTKYINLNLDNYNAKIIDFFREYGHNYMYSDITDNIYGYTYVGYNEFIMAESIIDMICNKIPNDLSSIEIARYLYIQLAKSISFDINADTNKCELYDLSLVTNVNNVWGSLAIGRVSSISAAKLYYYLCKRMNISSMLVIDDEKKAYVKLKINNQILLTDIFLDIAFVAANMQTKHFATYNNELEMDKKIGYITNNYNDYYIDKALKDIDYSDNFIWQILEKTQKIINIDNIKPMELNTIYKYIFDKYVPNYEIIINNLFLNIANRLHFIVISCNDIHYSYNYHENSFVVISDNDIIDNLNMGKIGLYLDEFIPNINYTKHLLS